MSKKDRLVVDEQGGVSTLSRKNDFSPDFKEGNIVSNDTAIFGNHLIGTSKEIVLFVSKEDFTAKYMQTIKDVFQLTDTQIRMMEGFLTMRAFRDEILWNTNTMQVLANKTGLSIETVHRFFPALSLHKKLLIKIRNGHYKINNAIVFHIEEIANLHLAKLTYTFKFQAEAETLKTMSERAMQISKELQEMYNQHLRDAQGK